MKSATARYCHKCGTEFLGESDFCHKCGAQALAARAALVPENRADAVSADIEPPELPEVPTTPRFPGFVFVILGLVGVAAIAAIAYTILGAAVQTDWPMLMGDAGRTGYAKVGPKPPLKLAWSFAAEGPVQGTPAVVRNTVYFVSRTGKYYALDSRTGKKKWSHDLFGEDRYGERSYGSPTVSRGILYFTASDGRLRALDAKTGKQVWVFRNGGISRSLSSPVVKDGTLYVTTELLWALDAKTGRVKWSAKANGFGGVIAVGSGMVFAGTHTALYAFDADTGRRVWVKPNGDHSVGSPAIVGGTVYATFHTERDSIRLRALDAETGNEKWSEETQATSASSLAIGADNIYFATMVYAPDHSNLIALDRVSGKKVWVVEMKDEYKAPVIADDAIYIGADGRQEGEYGRGILYSVNAKTGKQLSSYKLPSEGGWAAAPAVTNDNVFIGFGNSLYAFAGD